MSVSLQPVDEHATLLPHHDQRDAPTHSPALSASPIPPSPSSAVSASSGPSSSASDPYSPFSLPAVAPTSSPASSDGEEASGRGSAAARIKSLISGVSTSLIASAVRDKAHTDLQRLEEIFASPAEQAHLTKQQKWKLALRQQRLKLYLQQTQLEQQHQQQADHSAAQHDVADEGAEGQQAASASSGAHSLTIFTTPPLPPSVAPSLARDLSTFSLYTPDSLHASSFTFSTAPPLGLRTPSAPAEAAYTTADDERLNTESDDSSVLDDQLSALHSHGAALASQPSTPTSAASASAPQPHRKLPPRSRRGAASPLLAASASVQVSRSGRTIKRRFDVSAIGGRKSRRVTGVAQAAEAREGMQEEEQKVRAWEREYEGEESEEEEDSEEDVEHGVQHADYGVAYRQR